MMVSKIYRRMTVTVQHPTTLTVIIGPVDARWRQEPAVEVIEMIFVQQTSQGIVFYLNALSMRQRRQANEYDGRKISEDLCSYNFAFVSYS